METTSQSHTSSSIAACLTRFLHAPAESHQSLDNSRRRRLTSLAARRPSQWSSHATLSSTLPINCRQFPLPTTTSALIENAGTTTDAFAVAINDGRRSSSLPSALSSSLYKSLAQAPVEPFSVTQLAPRPPIYLSREARRRSLFVAGAARRRSCSPPMPSPEGRPSPAAISSASGCCLTLY
jgi:hypothetical protein